MCHLPGVLADHWGYVPEGANGVVKGKYSHILGSSAQWARILVKTFKKHTHTHWLDTDTSAASPNAQLKKVSAQQFD